MVVAEAPTAQHDNQIPVLNTALLQMDKQPSSTAPSRTSDKRQQANSNPDRPPIDPDDPNAPDPFDPFETAHMTDGGALIQDETELAFEAQLSKALPSTESPVTPDTPSPTQSEQPTQPDTTVEKTEQDHSETTPVAIEDGTLVHTVISFLTEADPAWSYVIEAAADDDTLTHHAVRDGSAVFSIRKIVDAYCVYHEPDNQRMSVGTDPNEYADFETAMAAFVEGIDWGTLPPGDGDPQIWTYSGYQNNSGTFQQYLSGRNNSECGGHYFSNLKAAYGIEIQSFADRRDSAEPGQTMTIVTITDAASYGDGNPIYRTRFPGQQTAFNTILSALDNGLSNKIALHSNGTGNTDWIPSIRTLQERP